MSPHMCF